MSKPVCVIWLNDANIYAQALAHAGVIDRFEVHSVKMDDPIPDDLAERTEILVGWRPGRYLTRMRRLRWIQAMTAGVEAWLESPDVRSDIALTCARGSHRLSMPENILGALFHLAKPYMAIALDQKESHWTRRVADTLAGKTLGVLGLGAVGHELARKASALEMRVIGTRRSGGAVAHVEKVFAPEATAGR